MKRDGSVRWVAGKQERRSIGTEILGHDVAGGIGDAVVSQGLLRAFAVLRPCGALPRGLWRVRMGGGGGETGGVMGIRGVRV